MGEEELAEWFESRGWVFGRELEADDEIGRSRDIVWVDPDSETTLHLIFDQYTDVRYVGIVGERAEGFAKQYADELEVFYGKESMMASVFCAEDVELQMLAISHLAAGAPPVYDKDYFDAFAALFELPEPKVRMEAVAALAYPDWPELRPLLEEVYEQERDPRVRRAIRDFLTYPAGVWTTDGSRGTPFPQRGARDVRRVAA